MITEFTCGRYTASFNSIGGPKWFVNVNNNVFAIIDPDGKLISFNFSGQYFTQEMLIEFSVLMNNIKRQYKQLQTT